MLQVNSCEQYSIWVGLIYVFNLIVGTGALALPAVFSRAGWLLGSAVVLLLAFISFMTVTFVIETMASANAILLWRQDQHHKNRNISQDSAIQPDSEPTMDIGERDPTNSDSEDTRLLKSPERSIREFFSINVKIEMGQMAAIFFSKIGITFFYICLTIYLYGDLSIYGAAIAKSMADVSCTYIPQNFTCNDTIQDTERCWDSLDVNRLNAYRMFLSLFIMALGPFAFFNVQKTKYLQVFTSLMRWLALIIMIIYASRKLIIDGPEGRPPKSDITGLPTLFGVCVYSFMCHHSLPALLAPISDKSKLKNYLSLDFISISFVYLLLALTGVFAFEQLDDLYTLDFVPRNCSNEQNIFLTLMDYFLALFPVFTLSTNFPVIAITLRNNLKSLLLSEHQNQGFLFQSRKIFFPALAVLPPYLVALCTKNLSILVSVTGSYAGTGIQYLIPIFLVYNARQKISIIFGEGVPNRFASPFSGNGWLIFIFIWSIVCVLLVTVHFYVELV